MARKKYRLSAEERAYFRKKAREWRQRNPKKARKISREAQKKFRDKMKAKGYRIRLIRGKWKWMKDKTQNPPKKKEPEK